MSERNSFERSTVLLVGAGCPAGSALAVGFARAGGRVIAVDRDEAAVLQIAAQDPERIDPLRLDSLCPDQAAMFADIWEDEPLNILVHLQPLRHRDALSAVIPSILTLTERLKAGLGAGRGKVLVVSCDMPDPATPEQRALRPALERLARSMQPVSGAANIPVNAIHLSSDSDAGTMDHLVRAAMWLMAPDSPPVNGSLLRLGAGGD